MAYLTAANLRPDTALYADCTITPSEADDTRLAQEIVGATQVLDNLTSNKFEDTTVTSYTYQGDGTNLLKTIFQPQLTSVASVTAAPIGGGSYTVSSSLYAVTTRGLQMYTGNREVVFFPDDLYPMSGSRWYENTIYTLATIHHGAATVPEDIKRAVALLVVFRLKEGAGMHRAIRWQSGQTVYEVDPKSPSGIPEVDRIILRNQFGSRSLIRFA